MKIILKYFLAIIFLLPCMFMLSGCAVVGNALIAENMIKGDWSLSAPKTVVTVPVGDALQLPWIGPK